MPTYQISLRAALCHEALSNSETKEPRIFEVNPDKTSKRFYGLLFFNHDILVPGKFFIFHPFQRPRKN